MAKSDPISALMRQYQAVCRERDALKAAARKLRDSIGAIECHSAAAQDAIERLMHALAQEPFKE